jgi:8-oxo-dGTP pyrophosphatase MutT (NUDIX family)
MASVDVSPEAYMAARPELECLITGAVVFSTTPDQPSVDHMLLIKRAAHDLLPSLWEIPGGSVDSDDPTILHGLGRELWEEAGLVLRSVVSWVSDPKGLIFMSRSGRPVAKFTFEVEVESEPGILPKVIIDPNEHEAFVWATEEECHAGMKGDVQLNFTSDTQKQAIFDAFELRKARRARGPSRVV